MTRGELARIREWCDAKIPTMTDPHLLAEVIKLRDAVAIVEASGQSWSETDAEIQALAERLLHSA